MIFKLVDNPDTYSYSGKKIVSPLNNLISTIQDLQEVSSKKISFSFDKDFTKQLNQDIKKLKEYQKLAQSDIDVTDAESDIFRESSPDLKSYALGNDINDEKFIKNYVKQQKKLQVATMAQNADLEKASMLMQGFNAGSKKTGLTTKEYTEAINSTNQSLGKYLIATKKGEASTSGFTFSVLQSKIALMGMQVAATLANAAISVGLSFAIQGIITLIDNCIHKSENLIEAGETAKEEIDSLSSSFKSVDSLVSGSGKEFAKLAQGVDMLSGKNKSLSTDDYSRFLELSNQLAETFPSLSRTYDENGNAIVQMNGDVNSITKSLNEMVDAQRLLTNQEIATKLPDLYKGAKEQVKQYNEEIGKLDTAFAMHETDFVYDTPGDNNTRLQYDKDLRKILDKYNISYDREENIATGKMVWTFDKELPKEAKKEIEEYFNEEQNAVQNEIDTYEAKKEEQWSSVKGSLVSWMTTTDEYSGLSSDIQNLAQQILDGLDLNTLDFSNVDELQDYIRENIFGPISGTEGEEISDALSNIANVQYDYNSGKTSLQNYLEQAQNFAEIINGLELDEQVKSSLLKTFDVSELSNQVDKFTKGKGEDFVKWAKGLSSTEFDVALGVQVDKDTSDWNLEQWKDAVERETKIQAAVSLDIEVEKENIENIQAAIQESFSGSGLSDGSISNIEAIFSEFDYDSGDLFKKTANGIRLDSEELQKLQAEYENTKKINFREAIAELTEEYNNLGQSIATAGTEAEKTDFMSQQDDVAQQIEDISTLAAQYDGLTSSYNKWLQAQQAPDKGDMYDTIRDGLEGIKEAYDDGLVGTNEFREYVDLLSGEDLSTASVDEVVKAYENLDKTIKNTSYSALDFLDKDGEGVEHLLNALKEVGKANGQAWATVDDEGRWTLDFTNAEFGGLTGDDAVAKALGIDTEFLQAILDKAGAYGFDVDLNSPIIDLENLTDAATQANEKLIELGKTNVSFNLEASGDELEKQVEQAQKIYDSFKDEDGKINSDTEGAEEAKTILFTLLKQKAELEQPAVMDVEITDANDATQNLIAKLQDFQSKYSTLQIMTQMGLDTTQVQKEVDAALSEAQTAANAEGVNVDVKAKLNFNSRDLLNQSLTSEEGLTRNVLIGAKLDLTEVNNTKVPNKNTTVTAKVVGQTQVDALKSTIDSISDKTVTVTYKQKTVTPSANAGTIKAKYQNGDYAAQGTAHAKGTAFANGDWGTKDSGVALGGELGQELVS